MNQLKQILQLNLGLSIVYVPSFIVYWNILDSHLVSCGLHGLLVLVHLLKFTDCKRDVCQHGKLYSELEFII